MSAQSAHIVSRVKAAQRYIKAVTAVRKSDEAWLQAFLDDKKPMNGVPKSTWSDLRFLRRTLRMRLENEEFNSALRKRYTEEAKTIIVRYRHHYGESEKAVQERARREASVELIEFSIKAGRNLFRARLDSTQRYSYAESQLKKQLRASCIVSVTPALTSLTLDIVGVGQVKMHVETSKNRMSCLGTFTATIDVPESLKRYVSNAGREMSIGIADSYTLKAFAAFSLVQELLMSKLGPDVMRYMSEFVF